jgi:hypothetical protein
MTSFQTKVIQSHDAKVEITLEVNLIILANPVVSTEFQLLMIIVHATHEVSLC